MKNNPFIPCLGCMLMLCLMPNVLEANDEGDEGVEEGHFEHFSVFGKKTRFFSYFHGFLESLRGIVNDVTGSKINEIDFSLLNSWRRDPGLTTEGINAIVWNPTLLQNESVTAIVAQLMEGKAMNDLTRSILFYLVLMGWHLPIEACVGIVVNEATAIKVGFLNKRCDINELINLFSGLFIQTIQNPQLLRVYSENELERLLSGLKTIMNNLETIKYNLGCCLSYHGVNDVITSLESIMLVIRQSMVIAQGNAMAWFYLRDNLEPVLHQLNNPDAQREVIIGGWMDQWLNDLHLQGIIGQGDPVRGIVESYLRGVVDEWMHQMGVVIVQPQGLVFEAGGEIFDPNGGMRGGAIQPYTGGN
jgi:hypothetical protein